MGRPAGLPPEVQFLLRMPGGIHSHRDVVMDAHCQKARRIDLEVSDCFRNGSDDAMLQAFPRLIETNLSAVRCMPSKRDIQIRAKRRLRCSRFRDPEAHSDGKLRSTNYLDHAQIAIRVTVSTGVP
jgi:hypothetical protein